MHFSRRNFVASGLLLPFASRISTSALDMDWETSAIMGVFDVLPDHDGPDGFDFPVTTGVDNRIQRDVWPENPDRYWDPDGEDIVSMFGFHPRLINLSGTQVDTTIWLVNNNEVDLGSSASTLQRHGWEVDDDGLNLLRYAGTDDARKDLAASLNMFGDAVIHGRWDWIAMPTLSTIVMGADVEIVRQVADRVQNHTAMTTIDRRFHGLKPLLTPETYHVTLLPPQALPVKGARASFVAKTWTGDVPIVQSIGLRLDSPDLVEPTIESVKRRLDQEASPISGERYGSFLELVETETHYASVRLDFIDHSGDWDVARAWSQSDLGMLEPA